MELQDKIPPHSHEAESAVLGSLLLDWGAMSETATVLRKEHFYSYQNQAVYEAMLTLYKHNVRGDSLSVISELEKNDVLDKAGGASYVASLTDIVPTAANINYYTEIVLDKALRRELLAATAEIRAECFDKVKEAKSVLEEAEKAIFSLSDVAQKAKVYDMRDVVSKTIETIDARYKNNSELTGIPSGINELDSLTSGFQPAEFIVIGARPSIGKTAFALSMMQKIAIEKNIPCAFFSLEMSYQSIGQRFLSQVARIAGNKLRSGQLSMADFQKLQDAAGMCYNAPLFLVDVPNMKLMELRALARRVRINHNVEIIFIDYIGLITTDNPQSPVYEQVSEISKSLKSLARELNIPIVALCQVARDAEGQPPNLAQLRGSGSIEQDADVVIFLHRDRKIMEEHENVQDAKCILAKQRNGATGEVVMKFFPAYTKFENSAKD